MMHVRKMWVLASILIAASAAAQPVYEIGYRFNDGDEVAFVEAEPFSIEVHSDLVALPSIQHLVINFPFAEARRQGLTSTTGQIRRSSALLPDLRSVGRASVTFTDLVFASSGTDPIEVDMVVNFGRSLIAATAGRAIAGTFVEATVIVELDGDERVGRSLLSFDDFGRSEVERTGFLEGLPADRHAIVEGLMVPVNAPISLRFEVEREVFVPAGEDFVDLRLLPAEDDRPAPGLPIDRPVFVVPDGVAVSSEQAGVRNNRFIVCAADLDFDGVLTIFDFLAFQNLFDAGDPLADFDGDGEFTVFDFLEFQNLFDAGC